MSNTDMPKPVQAISLRAEFSEAALRAAVGSITKETFRSSLCLCAVMALVGIGCLAAIAAGATMGGVFPYVAFGTIAASLFWGTVVALNYRATMTQCLRLFRQMPSRAVDYKVTESGISVASAAWSGVIPWSSMNRIVRRPSLMLVGLGKALISQVKPAQVHIQSAIGDEILPRTALSTLWRFPVLWNPPSMAQLLLVIPRTSGDESLVTAIVDRARTKGHPAV